MIFSLGGLIVWYVGGRDVLAGKMTLGSLMAFLAFLAMFYAPLSTLSQLTTWLSSFMTGCQRVFELFDTLTETHEPARSEAVKIQSQIARNTQFEAALNGLDEAGDEGANRNGSGPWDEPEEADFAPLWLEPDTAELREGPFKTLEVELANGTVHRSVLAVRCFPATRRDDFISLRTWDREGHVHELGIVRQLEKWSSGHRELVHAALARCHFLRRNTAIEDIKLEYGFLVFQVTTDQGPTEFTMRWTQRQAQDFGERGKALLDTEDNRFLVTDTYELPQRERELLQRYDYW